MLAPSREPGRTIISAVCHIGTSPTTPLFKQNHSMLRKSCQEGERKSGRNYGEKQNEIRRKKSRGKNR